MSEEGVRVFNAQLTATDEATKTIEHVGHAYDGLAKKADHVGHATEHMHRPKVWTAIGEHINLTKEHFGELHASIGEVGSSITELLPALGALGAAGGIAALFETAEHVSEAYAELSHTASSLGVATQDLHDLHIVAKLTDTSVEAMDHSVSKLNKTIAESASGKNKDAASLFHALGISLHGASGHLKSGTELLPELAHAFQHTQDAAMRTRMAFALFGKGGAELIPMLRLGRDHLKELKTEAAELGFNFGPYGEGLEAYNESMKKLSAATTGFTDEVGAKLAPVLRPVVDLATKWVVANRDWIATGITGKVEELAHWVEKVDLKRVEHDFEEAGHYTGEFVTAIGGPERAVELLAGAMLLKGVVFLAEPLIQATKFGAAIGKLTIKLGSELVGAWNNVGNAAAAAEGKEVAALAVAGGASAAEAEAAVAAGASGGGGRFAALDRLHGNLKSAGDYRIDAKTSHGIRSGAIGVGLQTLFAGLEAEKGFDETKEFIRQHPSFAAGLTRKQFDALPERNENDIFGYDLDSADPAKQGWLGRTTRSVFGPSPYASSARDGGLPFKVETEAHVTVEFANAPAGTTASVTSSSGGQTTTANVTGQAWGDHYGRPPAFN